MSQIYFHEDFYIPILKGCKTQTSRFGEPVPDLGIGRAIFPGGKSIPIKIKAVSYKTFADLSMEEIQKDGFHTKGESWYTLLTFYPYLKESDELMLIEFELIQE